MAEPGTQPRSDAPLTRSPSQGGPPTTGDEARRGEIIRRLRLILVVALVAIMVAEPPERGAVWCWCVVGGYLAWTLAVDVLLRRAGRRDGRLVWMGLVVDMAVLAALTMITSSSAAVSWTPYLLLTGFFMIPVMAAAQLSTSVCFAVGVPALATYLGTGLVVRRLDDEPVAYVLLRTLLLAAVFFGALLLTRLQRARVARVADLLAQRNLLLAELVSLQQREQRELAETLHDGALQYVLAARQELDDAVEGDREAGERTGQALVEASRLLRSTTSQLHPAVLDAAGLPAALADLVQTAQARGRFDIDLVVHDWDETTRTSADDLLLGTARELVTNAAKHAHAQHVVVELSQADGGAVLVVADDGVGMDGIDVAARLREGHLGLAARRIQVEAASGTLELHPVQPHGLRVQLRVPLTWVTADRRPEPRRPNLSVAERTSPPLDA